MNSKEILYDHYKDTVKIAKKEENKRNKLFIIILLHILILFLISIKPNSMFNIFSDLLIEKLKIGMYFGVNVLQVIIMLSLMYSTIRYFQINIYLDRIYDYIHKIEDELQSKVNKRINREGKNYLNKYPKTLNLIYYSYKYFFPIVYIIAVISRFIINDTWNIWYIKLIEGTITILIVVLNILYMIDTYNEG